MELREILETIEDATEIHVRNVKLNSFMDRGLIKVIQKGGTDGKELKNWEPITLLSQIYKAYQNTANI